jgi:hypothetical protein
MTTVKPVPADPSFPIPSGLTPLHDADPHLRRRHQDLEPDAAGAPAPARAVRPPARRLPRPPTKAAVAPTAKHRPNQDDGHLQEPRWSTPTCKNTIRSPSSEPAGRARGRPARAQPPCSSFANDIREFRRRRRSDHVGTAGPGGAGALGNRLVSGEITAAGAVDHAKTAFASKSRSRRAAHFNVVTE